MIRQLTFDLPVETRLTRADFFVSAANQLALAALDGWHDWPSRKMLLVGPPGAGKSHLAQIWAMDAKAQIILATDLEAADIAGLAAEGAVVVEDAQMLAGNTAAETALFHLHNLLEVSGHLLVTAQSAPRDWGLVLPDLASRLQAAPLTRISPPDDGLLSAVLAKLFADRQIVVPANLIPYLLARMDRSIAAAHAMVDALDAQALSQHRPITRALAAEILESHQTE